MKINETLTPNIINLKKKFQNDSLALDIEHLAPNFYREFNGNEPDSIVKFIVNNPKILTNIMNEWDDRIIDVENGNIDIICDVLNDNPELGYTIYDSELYRLSNNSAFKYNKTIINKWLVHNSKHALEIAKNGFKYGNNINNLAYSEAGILDGKENGDYLFAFTIENTPEPNVNNILRYAAGDNGGSIAFIGSGIEAYHNGDQEDQVIFDKNQPSECFLITKMKVRRYNKNIDCWCVIGNDKILFACSINEKYSYKKCLNWIINNGQYYSNQMYKWNIHRENKLVENALNYLKSHGYELQII